MKRRKLATIEVPAKQDRLSEAVSTMRKLRDRDPAGFAILCSVIERLQPDGAA